MNLFKTLKHVPSWMDMVNEFISKINNKVDDISLKIEELFKYLSDRNKSDDFWKCKTLYLHLLNANQELDLDIDFNTMGRIGDILIEVSTFIGHHKNEIDSELMADTVNMFETVCEKYYKKYLNKHCMEPACYNYWMSSIANYRTAEE